MSYTSLIYHIVFSTKGRKRLLSKDKIDRLAEYMTGVARNINCRVFIINGCDEHIHIAVSLNSQISLADFVRTIKANTSRWIHKTFSGMHDFAWQEGYSAFTVSYSGLEKVIDYIKSQEVHHKKTTFEEELAIFLKKHKIEFDKRYFGG